MPISCLPFSLTILCVRLCNCLCIWIFIWIFIWILIQIYSRVFNGVYSSLSSVGICRILLPWMPFGTGCSCAQWPSPGAERVCRAVHSVFQWTKSAEQIQNVQVKKFLLNFKLTFKVFLKFYNLQKISYTVQSSLWVNTRWVYSIKRVWKTINETLNKTFN